MSGKRSFPCFRQCHCRSDGKAAYPGFCHIQKGDVKIGIIGLTTPETVVTTNPKNVYGLKFLDDKATIAVTQNLVKKLKEEDKCDLIVAVGHLGSEDANRGHRSDDILMNVDGIDIL